MIKLPKFWQQTYSPISWLLLPISWLYSLGFALKRMFSSTYQSQLMVISVGNINVGGVGKTPVCLKLGKLLQEEGIAFAFLSRGYQGNATEIEVVDPEKDEATEVGDEALLLAAVGDTYVYKNKINGIKAIENSQRHYQVIILDDGLQSFNIIKNFNILVLDGEYGFGNGRILPAGPLRQKLTSLHEKIDQVIINGFDLHGLRDQFDDTVRVFNSYTRIEKKKNPKKDKNVIAFTGIGRPEKFFKTLADETDYTVVEEISFPDHYYYTKADLDTILSYANQQKLGIITTEKDWQRLPLEYRKKIDCLKIYLELDSPTEFKENILSAIRKFNNEELE